MKSINEAIVLIVDDTEENIEILVNALGDDYEISVAMDGMSALETLEYEIPDIILLDVMMPGMDGYEVCQRIKADEKTAGVPVIFLTALTDVEAKTRGFDAGAVDFVSKPFEIQEVRARVRTHLSIYFMGLELEKQKRIAEDHASAKAEFLAVMSHEIRTPMNGVLGMTQLLLGTPLNKKQRGFAQTIYDSGSLLLSIINDILDHSKLESGKFELDIIPFSPRKLFNSIIMLMGNRIENKGLSLDVSIAEDVADVVLGDAGRIRQIMLNFIGNAVKFTDKGKITIGIKSLKDGYLYFSVSDTGIGISQEGKSKLFKDFSQVDSSISRKYGGTGLGLYICSKIVKIMNGEIGVKSEVGRGSEFWFEIPAEVTDLQEVELSRPSPSVSLKLPKLRILLAEDNIVNQRVVEGMLDNNYHEISIAQNGVEAVQACDEHVYDVVLMDMQMPLLNGSEATEKIRKLTGKMATVPVIALTANAFEQDKLDCYAAGMNGYLAKPIQYNALIAEIARVINVQVEKEYVAEFEKPDLTYIDSQQIVELEETVGRDAVVQIFKEFVKNVYAVLENMKKGLDISSRSIVEFDAHKIKGTCGNIAMKSLAEQAYKIEVAAKEDEWADISKLISGFDRILDLSLQEVESLFPEVFDNISVSGITHEFLSAKVITELEDLLFNIKDAIDNNSIDEYENIANDVFSLDLTEQWLENMRKIDYLILGIIMLKRLH